MLFAKRRLQKYCILAIHNNMRSFRNRVIELIQQPDISEEELEKEYNYIMRAHLDDCINYVINKIAPPYSKMQREILSLLMNASPCGYDLNFDEPLHVGAAYAICYYAVTGQTADAAICVQLNHYHAYKIDEALEKCDISLAQDDKNT